MTRKVALPSISSINTEGTPFGTVVFLQALHDGVTAIDNSAVYRDAINIAPHTPRIRARSAAGQMFSISGANVAAGADYAALVNDVELLIRGYTELAQQFNALVSQLKGT